MGRGASVDERWMKRALALARRGAGRTTPNPMVGAVLVRDGRVVGEGWHAELGGAHAERMALDAAGPAARGATLYVTLEPCNHTGRTPPCAPAVIAAGVSRVVYASVDPNPASRRGREALANAGVVVTSGVCAPGEQALNAHYHHRFASARPFITLKLAVSLDDALADHARRPGWLTGERARREVHRLRAGHDATAVGSGTVLADDPLLTVRGVRRPRVAPARVVFDRRARLPVESRLVSTAHRVPVMLLTADPAPAAAAALAAHGVSVIPARDLTAGLQALRARGVNSVLVEGGAALAASLLDAGVVDRMVIFRAPVLLGAGALPAFGGVPATDLASAPRWRLVDHRTFGDDEMATYAPAP